MIFFPPTKAAWLYCREYREEQGKWRSLQELLWLSRTARLQVYLEGRRGSSWCYLGLNQGPRPSLFGANVGKGLSCLPLYLQQCVHAVLRVDANLLVGQVSIKQLLRVVEDPGHCIRSAFSGHVLRALELQQHWEGGDSWLWPKCDSWTIQCNVLYPSQ